MSYRYAWVRGVGGPRRGCVELQPRPTVFVVFLEIWLSDFFEMAPPMGEIGYTFTTLTYYVYLPVSLGLITVNWCLLTETTLAFPVTLYVFCWGNDISAVAYCSMARWLFKLFGWSDFTLFGFEVFLFSIAALRLLGIMTNFLLFFDLAVVDVAILWGPGEAFLDDVVFNATKSLF